jgi:hypothetical protein
MITTRRATPEDIPWLVDMMAKFYAESGFLLDRDWASASFAALLDDVRGAAWIGSHHDDPAGYVVLTLRHSMEYGGLDGFIDDCTSALTAVAAGLDAPCSKRYSLSADDGTFWLSMLRQDMTMWQHRRFTEGSGSAFWTMPASASQFASGPQLGTEKHICRA